MTSPIVSRSGDHSKFRGKYRIASARCPGWDYSRPGWYFVTICTKDRIQNLSNIEEGRVVLSEIGCIVAEEWSKTPKVRRSVELGPYVVMPDHVHGLIFQTEGAVALGRTVNQIKSAATKRIRALLDPQFTWQARYHDRIIRDEAEFDRICRYIRDNPRRWESI